MNDTAPHFLIVGAPKCGTTSLYFYLQQHPSVFMPENKEPRFFCDFPVETFEFGTKQFHPNIVSDADAYRALFAPAPDGALCGEASTDYLWVPGTAARIKAWNPDARIVIMLRDPIERAYSEYLHTTAAAFQKETFWESLALEDERAAAGYDPIFRHVGRGLYFTAVKDFLDTFGRANVKVILFDDFVRDTAGVVKDTFRFLGLAPVEADVSERHNARASDDGAVARLTLKNGLRFLAKLKNGTASLASLTSLFRRRETKKVPLTSAQYESLRRRFADDVAQVSRLLDVDLSHWMKGA